MTGRKYCFVATGYLVRDGRTLLLKHKKLGMWLPPGGHIEEGETTDEAVLREVQRVQIEEIPGHNHHIDFIYYLRAKPGEHVRRPDESDDIRWHTHDELGLPHVPDEVRESGRDALATLHSMDALAAFPAK